VRELRGVERLYDALKEGLGGGERKVDRGLHDASPDQCQLTSVTPDIYREPIFCLQWCHISVPLFAQTNLLPHLYLGSPYHSGDTI